MHPTILIRSIVLETKDVRRASQVKAVFMNDGHQENHQNDQLNYFCKLNFCIFVIPLIRFWSLQEDTD